MPAFFHETNSSATRLSRSMPKEKLTPFSFLPSDFDGVEKPLVTTNCAPLPASGASFLGFFFFFFFFFFFVGVPFAHVRFLVFEDADTSGDRPSFLPFTAQGYPRQIKPFAGSAVYSSLYDALTATAQGAVHTPLALDLLKRRPEVGALPGPFPQLPLLFGIVFFLAR